MTISLRLTRGCQALINSNVEIKLLLVYMSFFLQNKSLMFVGELKKQNHVQNRDITPKDYLKLYKSLAGAPLASRGSIF